MQSFIVYLLLTSTLYAAFERVPLSFAQTSSGMSIFIPNSSPVSFFSHPAALAGLRPKSGAIFYEAPFRITNLNQLGASYTASFKSGQLGFGFHALGRKIYRESTVTVGFGRKFGNDLETGFIVNGQELSIKNYGHSRTIGLSASLNYFLSETVRWSLLYQNINGPGLGKTDELLPQIIATGFVYSPTPRIQSVIELERDLEFESRYKFGILWQWANGFTIATGFINHPAQITAGISLQFKGQRINYACFTHPELALSQLLSVQFSLP